MTSMPSLEESLSEYRGRLLGLAYRMLGCRADAEDVLQDAFLRIQKADQDNIRSHEAFLVTTVTRLCLDRIKRERSRREVYCGPWLPEPILDAEQLSPQTAAEIADDLSFALMLSLEKLSALERAAFLLHDIFDRPFSHVAEVLDKNETACRQLASRARRAIQADRPASVVSIDVHAKLLQRFVEAVQVGDTAPLESLFKQDVVAYTDGGGVKSAALVPIRGKDKVARLFIGVARKRNASGGPFEIDIAPINGLPGLILCLDGELDQTLSINVVDNQIAAIYVVRNPDKLAAIKS